VPNTHVQENDASRKRMTDLLNRLSDAQLATPMENDWTPAAYLVHIAFFDRRALELAKRFKTAADVYEPALDVHVLNDALLPQWRLIDPRAAANEALAAAGEADAAIAALPDEIVNQIQLLEAFSLNRSGHRKTHLDEIEPMFP
jgi:DinB superfamily